MLTDRKKITNMTYVSRLEMKTLISWYYMYFVNAMNY